VGDDRAILTLLRDPGLEQRVRSEGMGLDPVGFEGRRRALFGRGLRGELGDRLSVALNGAADLELLIRAWRSCKPPRRLRRKRKRAEWSP
jgi:hypothetical protein